MKGYNSWTVVGNLGSDPELRYTQSGTAVAGFSLAVNSTWKDRDGNVQERTEWVTCTAWQKAGELIVQYCHKGDPLLVSGRSQTDEYEQDGVKKRATKLVVETFVLLGGKRDGGRSGDREEEPGPREPEKRKPAADDDDLPF